MALTDSVSLRTSSADNPALTIRSNVARALGCLNSLPPAELEEDEEEAESVEKDAAVDGCCGNGGGGGGTTDVVEKRRCRSIPTGRRPPETQLPSRIMCDCRTTEERTTATVRRADQPQGPTILVTRGGVN